MSIEIRIAGNLILNVKSLVVHSSMTTLSNSFTLMTSLTQNATTAAEGSLVFQPGDTVEIKIESIPVLTGFVDAVRVTYTKGVHNIEVVGRDKIADFIDSSVPQINIEGAIEFETLLRTTLDTMGLQEIAITNLIPATSDLLIRADKNIASEVGQTGADFIDQFARLKQVLLKGDGSGNIQMTRGGGDQYIRVTLANVPGFDHNNIIKGQFVLSHTNRYNSYTVRSQEDFSADFDLDVSEGVGNSGTAVDNAIRVGRSLVFEAEENSTTQECKNRSAWESDLRRAKGTQFIVTILGHTATYTDPGFGETTVLWSPNSLVRVADVFANIQALMLIESVRYQISEDEGTTTEMTLVPRDSYTVSAQRDAADARVSLIGDDDE